jgi:flagellar biosynthesis protein FlhF
MQVKRFLAADMRRALEMVRQELGPDAVILSSNRTKDGVELLTTQAAVSLPEAAEKSVPATNAESGESLSTGRASETGQQRADAIERARQRQLAQRELDDSAREFLQPNQRVNAGIRVERSLLDTAGADREPVRANKSEPNTSRPAGFVSAAERYPLRDDESSVGPVNAAGPETTDPRLDTLQAELSEMRYLLEEQLSQMLGPKPAARAPGLASIGRRLERMGLSSEAAEAILNNTPADQPLAQAWTGALAQLARKLPADGADPVSRGGVYALVGPTGAGKTTTIGKLAARYVMEHGARDVALVTLDTHRIGGHDQLRSLARILGVTLRVVDDQSSLESVLYSLRRHALVLIDTAGFRQGDPRLTEQLETLRRLPQVKPLMVLPSTSQAAMLKASVHAYGGQGLTGCILSKLDESASLGEALGVVMQAGVPIVYTTDGQDIPRDIQVARPHQLVTRAASLVAQRDDAARRPKGATATVARRAL